MTKQTKEEIRETLEGWNTPSKPPVMTDRAKLAMRIYENSIDLKNPAADLYGVCHSSIEAANIFYDTIENTGE